MNKDGFVIHYWTHYLDSIDSTLQ